MAGFRVRYTLATKLVNELVEAADDMVLTKTIARYGRVDLLCIDLSRPRDYADMRTGQGWFACSGRDFGPKVCPEVGIVPP